MALDRHSVKIFKRGDGKIGICKKYFPDLEQSFIQTVAEINWDLNPEIFVFSKLIFYLDSVFDLVLFMTISSAK